MKTVVHTSQAPRAVGPYSQAIIAGGTFMFCSGQISLDPQTDQLILGDVGLQADRVLKNIQALLESQGRSFRDVVKSTIFLTNMSDFTTVNEIYSRYFQEPYPARSTVAVAALPKGVSVEIEVIVQMP